MIFHADRGGLRKLMMPLGKFELKHLNKNQYLFISYTYTTFLCMFVHYTNKKIFSFECRSVEFLEHVGLNYHANYVAAFRKAALIFVTASTNTGWHHVEVHTPNWWIRKYESYGFKYDDTLTQELRQIAKDGKKDYMAPNGVYLDGFYVRSKLMVFVNPMVASLPEHAHLFPETGCVHKPWGRHPCAIENGETPLPDSMLPLNLTQAMDDAWMNLIKENVEGMPK